jgi:hypothetical protein
MRKQRSLNLVISEPDTWIHGFPCSKYLNITNTNKTTWALCPHPPPNYIKLWNIQEEVYSSSMKGSVIMTGASSCDPEQLTTMPFLFES